MMTSLLNPTLNLLSLRMNVAAWWALRQQKRRRARAAASGDDGEERPPVVPYVPDDFALRLVGSSIGVGLGESIDTWADESGNGNDATQYTVSSQPTLQEVEFAGKTFNVARFDTVDDGMETPLVISDDTPFSIFVMWRPADLGTTCSIISGGDSDWMMGTFSNAMLCYFTNWSAWTDHGAINTNDFYLFEARIAPGEDPLGICLNGAQPNIATGGGGSSDPDQVMLGATGLNGYPGGCDAAEILIYNRFLSDEEAAGVRAYFQDSYNYLKL